MLRNYFLLALKVLARRKFFTFVSLFGISLTLTTLIVTTSLIDTAYNPPAPEVYHDRTLLVERAHIFSPDRRSSFRDTPSYLMLDKCLRPLVRAGVGVERVSLMQFESVAAYPQGKKLSLRMKRTDGEFWHIFPCAVKAGALFTNTDDANGAMVAVINARTRGNYFGSAVSDAEACGRIIEADGQRFRVVAVVEDPPLSTLPSADMWVPISTAKSQTYKTAFPSQGFVGIILAENKAQFPQIKAAYHAALKQFPFPDPKEYNLIVSHAETSFESSARNLPGGSSSTEGEQESPTALLVGIIIVAMLMFMLLPAINLVNLNVSRILERSSEIGVRRAFGASRTTLVGQLIVENLVLTGVGSVIGFVLAEIALLVIEHSGIVVNTGLSINARVVLYGTLATLVFGLLSGVYPAWKMSRLHIVQALKGGTNA